MNCRLCKSVAKPFYTGRHGEYLECPNCAGVFLSPEHHLDALAERTRYEAHNNDIFDPRYQEFVAPIVDAVVRSFSPGCTGLDFGSGTGPVISHLLAEKGYRIDQYDPIFKNDPNVFRNRYDFVMCCEVIEHFRHPAREFSKLKDVLKPAGKLFCMTEVLTSDIDFKNWQYKEDPTHIFFYRPETLTFIERSFRFEGLIVTDRLIELSQEPHLLTRA
jgi:SAM-dependent methyltransferase